MSAWDGLELNETSTHVIGLRLWYRGLRGSIPAELGSLANLIYLDLYNNSLTGCIPIPLEELVNGQGLGLVVCAAELKVSRSALDLGESETSTFTVALERACQEFCGRSHVVIALARLSASNGAIHSRTRRGRPLSSAAI